MLAPPEEGLVSSSNSNHNSDRVIVCDWIEGSLLFNRKSLTKPDFVDVLLEQELYTEQDQASAFADIAWSDFNERHAWLGANSPYLVTANELQAKSPWEDHLPISFLLMLSFSETYSKVRKYNMGKYVEQGELFELFCQESLSELGWNTVRTGWSSGKGAQKLTAVVQTVSQSLEEFSVNDEEVSLFAESNEEGCDLVCQRAFKDRRGSRPVYLIQCASGENWVNKQGTPNLDTWRNFIGFSQPPQRGFCMPFALEKESFSKNCRRVSGMLVDRRRLLEPYHLKTSWLSASLAARLKQWIKKRLKLIPSL